MKSFLDRLNVLLTTEPARVIGYGAAVVVALVTAFMAERGTIAVALTFEQSVGAATGAIAALVIVIESIRRFAYSPMTYIEDLADGVKAAHEQAHAEEEMGRLMAQMVAEATADVANQQKTRVAVGTTKASNAGDLKN